MGACTETEAALGGGVTTKLPSDALTPEGTIYWWGLNGQIYESLYEVDEGLVFVDHDVAIGSIEDALADHREIARAIEDEEELKAILDTRDRRQWSGGTVAYRIDGDFDAADVARIRTAIRAWNDRVHITGLRWVEHPELSRRHPGAFFEKATRVQSDRCFAKIGRHPRRKNINLGADPSQNCTNPTTVAHEMGHVMGFHHEQRRESRSRWARMLNRNFRGRRSDYKIRAHLPRRFDGFGSYDHESVMHYATSQFGRPFGGTGLRMPVILNRQIGTSTPRSPQRFNPESASRSRRISWRPTRSRELRSRSHALEQASRCSEPSSCPSVGRWRRYVMCSSVRGPACTGSK